MKRNNLPKEIAIQGEESDRLILSDRLGALQVERIERMLQETDLTDQQAAMVLEKILKSFEVE